MAVNGVSTEKRTFKEVHTLTYSSLTRAHTHLLTRSLTHSHSPQTLNLIRIGKRPLRLRIRRSYDASVVLSVQVGDAMGSEHGHTSRHIGYPPCRM